MSIALKAVPGTVAISDDDMRRFAPSVFASQPIEGVSERYRFLPTSSILRDAHKWLGSRTRTRAEHSNGSTARLPETRCPVCTGRASPELGKEPRYRWPSKSGPKSFL